jgi:hypothetical protein
MLPKHTNSQGSAGSDSAESGGKRYMRARTHIDMHAYYLSGKVFYQRCSKGRQNCRIDYYDRAPCSFFCKWALNLKFKGKKDPAHLLGRANFLDKVHHHQ